MRAIAFFAAVSVATFITSQSQAQDAAAGEKVFAKCKACHVADEDKNKIGPSLSGVIGRTAGTHPGFKYSKAMVEAGESGVKWDDATLTDYLRDPKGMVKGTKMVFPGLKKDEDVANVIAYLKQFSK
jgi:cytochrome c